MTTSIAIPKSDRMNTRYILILIIYLLAPANSFAKKKPQFPVSKISESLRTDADAIVRIESNHLELISTKKVIFKYKTAITILNESGNHYGEIELYYDKTRPLSEIVIAIYDSEGSLIDRVKPNEIKDYSASGNSLFTDGRIRYYKPIQKNYPYTIVYSYTQIYNSYINLRGWYPYPGYRCAVEKSRFYVTSKEDNFRYKTYNLEIEPIINKQNDGASYSWELNQLSAIKKEPHSPSFYQTVPKVICAPNDFQMDKIDGQMSSWSEFGNWRYTLNNGRDELDLESQEKIKNLVKDCKTIFEKVKTIYEYLQNKTRYISIQVGIGGWQAFPAQDVEDKSYGDCKALSNYMKALLKVVDIPSYYTIVNAGSNANPTDTSFVHNFSNHAILMVPLKKDSIWLECTSKTQACGFLGSFTDDREVLCMTENGGKLVHTPRYKMSDNAQDRTANVTILPDGNAKAKVQTKYHGIQYENIEFLYDISLEEQKKKLYKNIDLPDFKIKEVKIACIKTRIPESELDLTLDIRNYASKSGDRLFIPLNLLNRSSYIPKKVKERRTSILGRREYCDIDSIHFSLPEGFKIENLPGKKIIASDFGNYSCEVIQNEQGISYIRKVEFFKFNYPADRYEDFRNYRKAIVRADKAKLVLKQEVL